MTLEVLQHIQQRLGTVIDDLKSAIGQEAARAYLTRTATDESLEPNSATTRGRSTSMKIA